MKWVHTVKFEFSDADERAIIRDFLSDLREFCYEFPDNCEGCPLLPACDALRNSGSMVDFSIKLQTCLEQSEA